MTVAAEEIRQLSYIRQIFTPLFLAGISWLILIAAFIFPVLVGESMIFTVVALFAATLVSLSGLWLVFRDTQAEFVDVLVGGVGGGLLLMLIALVIFYHLLDASMIFAVTVFLSATLVALSGLWLVFRNTRADAKKRVQVFVGGVACGLSLIFVFVLTLGLCGVFDSI